MSTTNIKKPFIITARLMAGVRIGDAFISIGQGKRNSEGRTQYGVFIDLPDGTEHEVTYLHSGCQGGEIQDGMASLLSFLSAAGESYAYAMRQGKDGMTGENSDLLPQAVTEWAYQNSDEISLLALEIEETPNLITKA